MSVAALDVAAPLAGCNFLGEYSIILGDFYLISQCVLRQIKINQINTWCRKLQGDSNTKNESDVTNFCFGLLTGFL